MSDWKLVPIESTEEMIRAAYDSNIVDFMVPREVLIRLFWEMTNAAPTPEVEPVGFLFRAKTDNKLTHFCRMEELSFWRTMGEVELLYTRPATSELVKAAEEAARLARYVSMSNTISVEMTRKAHDIANRLHVALDKVKS